MESIKVSMNLEDIDIGVSRMKSLLFMMEYLLIGADSIEDENLVCLKNIADMSVECMNGLEDKINEVRHSRENTGRLEA